MSKEPSSSVSRRSRSFAGRRGVQYLLRHVRLILALILVGMLLLPISSSRIPSFSASAGQNAPQTVDSEAAFSAKADPLLKIVRHAADRDRQAGVQGPTGHSEVEKLSRLVRVNRMADGSAVAHVIVRLKGNNGDELKAAGFQVGSIVGDIATVRVPVDKLPELASLASVRKITAARMRKPLNDRARQAVGVDNGSGQRVVSQTGKGVVVGVIDTGIDFRHLDFTRPGSNGTQTRIKAMLDMTEYTGQVPDPGWNYTSPNGNGLVGRLSTESDINADLASPKPAQASDSVKERDMAGHGTHVTGIAAGNGLASPTPGTYAGIAPEADLVIVKATNDNDGSGAFAADAIIDGLSFIEQQAAALNEPFSVNVSFGGHGGSPGDGTDPDERAIDTVVNGGPGRAVCVAAGNDGESGDHASGTVANGADVTLTFDDKSNPNDLTIYYPNTDRFTLTVTQPNGVKVSAGPIDGTEVDTTFLRIIHFTDDKQDDDQTNDQSSFFIIFLPGAESLGQHWSFDLHGASVVDSGHFDAWLDDTVNFNSPYADDSHEVSPPATSRGAISVGAFVTRSASQTIGSFAFFTSPGPTADGRQKPDVSAPGYYLYSAHGSDINQVNGISDSQFTYGTGSNALSPDTPAMRASYGGLLGTSMSTPVTTGSVALMLQAVPNLTIDGIKNALFTTASHDSFDPAGWEPHFGQGKVNVAAAIQQLQSQPSSAFSIDDARFFTTQQYRDFLSREPDQAGGDYWTSQITGCGANTACVKNRRTAVSAAFFISAEFQQSGAYVYRFYVASFGQQPKYQDFTQGHQEVVGGPDLNAEKAAFALKWVQGGVEGVQLTNNNNAPDLNFLLTYPRSMTAAQFVDALLNNIKNYDGVDLSAERSSLIAMYDGTDNGRAAILQQLVDGQASQAFVNKEFNPSFVLMQYFGYLLRDPDPNGYAFWLNVLNNDVPNNFDAMVCAFITSTEYQRRFGTSLTYSNNDCQ